MIHRHFLAIFFSATLFFAALYFFFTGTIDPYGVSPIRLSISGVNQYKPRRVDIDRLIKPFEVWKYQPNTVFLGTSRVHQSMDPSVLDGTRYAVAYNASIPASSLAMNAFHLGEYIKLNPNLRTVVVELFFYNFLGKKQEKRPQTSSEYFQNTAALFLSVETLQAAIATLKFNRNNPKPTYQITSNGFFYYPPGHNSKAGFDSFPDHIWKLSEGRGKVLDESAFDSLRKIIRISEEAGLELILGLRDLVWVN